MQLLVRAVLRHHLSHPWMAISTFTGVTLALVAVVSVHLLTAAVAEQLRETLPGVSFAISHEIRHPQPSEAAYFDLRRRWRAGEFPEVHGLVPLVEGRLGEYRVVGFDPLSLAGVSAAGGAGLLTADGVLVHASVDGVDEEIDLGGETVRVLGRFGRAEQLSKTVVADIAVAQRLLDQQGVLTAIGVVAGKALSGPAAFLDQAFPGIVQRNLEALRVGGFVAEVAGDVAQAQFTRAILLNLGSLSLLSAVVAGFLAYQTTVNSLRHRSVLLERLTVMGMPGVVIVLAVLLETLLLAAAAVPVALILGRAVAAGLLWLTTGGSAGLSPVLGLDHWALAKAGVLALLTAAISGLLAHRFVAGVAWRLVRGGLAAVASVLVVIGVALEGTGVAGVLCSVLGCCVLAVLAAGSVVRGAIRLIDALGSRMPVRWLVNLRSMGAGFPEVNAALGALLIACGTGMGIALMVESFRVAFDDMLHQRLQAELVVSSQGGFSAEELAWLRELDGVLRVGRYADGTAQLTHGPGVGKVELHFVDLDAAEARRYGGSGEPDPRWVMVNEQAARRFGLSPGGTVDVRNRGEVVSLTVASVFPDYGEPRPRLVVSLEWADVLGPVSVDRVGLDVAPSALSGVTAAVPARWVVTSQAEIRELARQAFTRTFRITDALTALALLVAVVGLYNALSALEVKRGNEYRLLAMLGFDATELRRMGLGQAVALSALVMILALPLGASIAWLLCEHLNPRAFGWTISFRFSLMPVATAVFAGMAAALLAGMLGKRSVW